jgi:hypothetical protein
VKTTGWPPSTSIWDHSTACRRLLPHQCFASSWFTSICHIGPHTRCYQKVPGLDKKRNAALTYSILASISSK